MMFSIITAAHNAADVLPGLLDSLAAQSCRDFELVLQDGASTDDTLAMAESYRERLPILSLASEPDTGIYDAWNKAVKRTTGDWLLFLGADDRLADGDVLAQTLTHIGDSEPNLAFASGGVDVLRRDGTVREHKAGAAQGVLCSLPKGMPLPFPGLFIRRSKALLHGFNHAFRIAADYDFLCRAWQNDVAAVRLNCTVTRMREYGLSEQPEMQFRQAYEKLKASRGIGRGQKIWVMERCHELAKGMAVSTICRLAGQSRAYGLLDAIRVLRGKEAMWKRQLAKESVLFSMQSTPIFIISFNRLTYLQELILWLEQNGLTNIIIVDNASTYPPLLEWLEAAPYRVERLPENMGHMAVWLCGRFDKILQGSWHVVTDCDVVPDLDCDAKALEAFHAVLVRYPNLTKAGFSLRLDDIPDHYALKNNALSWEGKFWKKEYPGEPFYEAQIDTTFALYRPGVPHDDPLWLHAARSKEYQARHMPWYEDSANLTEEQRYYQEHISNLRSSHWSITDLSLLKEENRRLQERVMALEKEVELLSRNWSDRASLILLRALRQAKARFLVQR